MPPKLIFLIPYRNRKSQKTHFSIYMKYILEDMDKDEYEIYFSHQCDNKPFNRGAMKNIGFIAMKNKYPLDYKNITFVFNDIDTIPAIKNSLNYYTENNIVKHFYGFEFTLGGIFSIKGADFEKCGGFPNFWGWGFEDKCIQERVIANNIIISRDNFFPIGHESIIHIMDDPVKLISRRDCWRIDENADKYNDIHNLEYTIDDNMINVKNFLCKYNVYHEELYKQDLIVDKTIKKEKIYSETLTQIKVKPTRNFKKLF
jgi:hypothetical protein